MIRSSKSLVAQPEDNRITDGIDTGTPDITEKDDIDARDNNNDFNFVAFIGRLRRRHF